MNSMDLLAKLLANENLNVVRAPVSTASMDIRSRTLTLPQWKEMTPAVEEMLVGHEVGHALFTTEEYIKEDSSSALRGYMNVIEDVRIEKKIKNKYPGLRPSFLAGYRELNERDFFEIKDRDFTKMLLIDRINLYFKVGFNCGVKFTTQEMEYVRRTDKCDSIADVYDLAVEMLNYTKEERQKMKDEMMENLVPEDEGDPLTEEYEEMDHDIFDDLEEGEDNNMKGAGGSNPNAKPKEVTDDEVESTTERALRKRLSNLADVDTQVQIFEPKLFTTHDPIVTYKHILKELPPELDRHKVSLVNRFGQESMESRMNGIAADIEKFKTESSRVVNYLVKEFEMKKSATNYKRATVSKTGELNVRKLHSYKLTQDLFKRITVVPDAKNHGMIFLLDWSGSMSHVIEDTVKQVINLSMFCKRAQIPFQVFAFSNGYEGNFDHDKYYREMSAMPESFTGFTSGRFFLLEFFNHKMTNSEFNRMVELLMHRPYNFANGYGLNSTPLNEGLLYMVDYVGKFIKEHNVEKVAFITLTDGEGHALGSNRSMRESVMIGGRYRKTVNYLRDKVTKREYTLSADGSDQTNVFLRVIKHRYDAATIGFHITSSGQRDLDTFVRYNMKVSSGSEAYSITADIKKQFREKDFALLTKAGRDEMYLLPASKQKINDGELVVGTDMNSRQIAKQFTKFMDVKKTSRVLLNRFVSVIA